MGHAEDKHDASPRCPDCGRPIERNPRSGEGIWNHAGPPGDCWRISYDGPGDSDDEYAPINERGC